MEVVKNWSDHSYPIESEMRICKSGPMFYYRQNEDVKIELFGLRNVKKESSGETSFMGLVLFFDEPMWIHLSESKKVEPIPWNNLFPQN